jgi:hypothetical protein
MKSSSPICYSLVVISSILGLQKAEAKTNLNNIYIGGHFGYMTTDTKYRILGAKEFGGENRLRLSGHGVNGGLHAGVGCFHGKNFPVYIGIEALASLSNMNTRETWAILNTPNSGTLKMGHKYSFGGALRLGTYIAKAMPYIKTGYINGRWEFTSIIDVLPPIREPSLTTKKSLSGLLLAIGMDMPLNEKIVFGIEGTHYHYKKFNRIHLNVSPGPFSVHHLYYKFKPQINILQIRLSYRI